MDTSSLENLLQAAAVDQLIGYEGNQTAHNLLQEVQGAQAKYPAYLGDLTNAQVDNTASFGESFNDGNFGESSYYCLISDVTLFLYFLCLVLMLNSLLLFVAYFIIRS